MAKDKKGKKDVEPTPPVYPPEVEAIYAKANTENPVPAILIDQRTLDAQEYGNATLQLLEQIAFSDIGEFLTWGGSGGVRIKASESLTPAQRRLVQRVYEDKDGNIHVEFVSKDQAIRMLGIASGLLKENHHHTGKIDIGLMDVLKALDGRTRGLPPK